MAITIPKNRHNSGIIRLPSGRLSRSQLSIRGRSPAYNERSARHGLPLTERHTAKSRPSRTSCTTQTVYLAPAFRHGWPPRAVVASPHPLRSRDPNLQLRRTVPTTGSPHDRLPDEEIPVVCRKASAGILNNHVLMRTLGNTGKQRNICRPIALLGRDVWHA